jgi:hypothetical protein
MTGTLSPLQRFFLAFVAFFYVLMNRRFAEEVNLVRDRQRLPLPPPVPPAVTPVPAPTPEPAPVPAPVHVAPATTPVPAPVHVAPATTPVPGPVHVAPAATPVPAPIPVAPPPPPAVAASTSPVVQPQTEALHVLELLQRDGRLIDFLSESLEGFSDSEIGAAARTVHAGCRKTLDAYVELEPVYREAEGANVTVAPGFDPNAVRLTGNVTGEPPFKGSLRHHGWRAMRAAFPPPAQAKDPRILAPAEVEL